MRGTVVTAKRALRRAVRPAERHLRSFGILSYHRVAEPKHDPWQLAVAPATFADQLAVFAQVGRFVPLDEVSQRRRRLVPGRTAHLSVTFDDGYADNLTAALPILESADVPATVFITTGMIDRAGFWWDALDDALLDEQRPVGELVEVGQRLGLLTAGPGPDDRAALQSTIHTALAERLPLDVEALVDELLDELSAPAVAPGARPLTTDELVVLGRHPLITIGVHTVHHARLSRAGAELAAREVAASSAYLDGLLGPRARPFAYPHGDFDATVIEVVRRSGCTCAVTTDHRWVRSTDSPMVLPRLTVTDQPGAAAWSALDAVR